MDGIAEKKKTAHDTAAAAYSITSRKLAAAAPASTSPKRFTHRGTAASGRSIAQNCAKTPVQYAIVLNALVNGSVSSQLPPVRMHSAGIIRIEMYGIAEKK